MRRLSQKIELKVQNFERILIEGTEAKDSDIKVVQQTPIKPSDVSGFRSSKSSSESLNMPGIDFSVEVPPEIWAGEKQGRLGATEQLCAAKQRATSLQIQSLGQPVSSPGEESDKSTSEKTVIILPARPKTPPTNGSRLPSTSATSSSLSKHHCILVGHVFERVRLSELFHIIGYVIFHRLPQRRYTIGEALRYHVTFVKI
jgi:hypothetical protein